MNYDKLFQENFKYQVSSKDVDSLQNYLIKKKGWVYIAYSDNNHLLKIGRTGKNPLERARTLSTVGVLHDYQILFAIPVFNQFIVEAKVHERLKKFNVSKEFFSVSKDVAIEALNIESKKEESLLGKFLNVELIKEDLSLLSLSINK